MEIAEVVQWQTPNITISRIGHTNGGEYASACPYCGGHDRFRIWPNEGETGRFWCRQCNEHGDLIDHLRRQKGMTFQEACQAAGKTPTKKRWLDVDVSWRKEKPVFEKPIKTLQNTQETRVKPIEMSVNVEKTVENEKLNENFHEPMESPIQDFYVGIPECQTCEYNVKGWCMVHPRNQYVNVHFIDRCPR